MKYNSVGARLGKIYYYVQSTELQLLYVSSQSMKMKIFKSD